VLAVFACVLACGCGEETATDPDPTPRFSERGGDTFQVGDTISLQVNDFAGAVEIKPGVAASVDVNYTKWAAQEADLAKIDVSMAQMNNTLEVVTSKPTGLNNVSVDLDIACPTGCELVIVVAAGSIRSSIRPGGNCRFDVAAGNIVLELPADIGATVDLRTAAGTVSVEFTVNGSVSSNVVTGTIGAGDEVDIRASVAAGNIQVTRLP
jgi:hypothetical protein